MRFVFLDVDGVLLPFGEGSVQQSEESNPPPILDLAQQSTSAIDLFVQFFNSSCQTTKGTSPTSHCRPCKRFSKRDKRRSSCPARGGNIANQRFDKPGCGHQNTDLALHMTPTRCAGGDVAVLEQFGKYAQKVGGEGSSTISLQHRMPANA
jgi:hypothetical protein